MFTSFKGTSFLYILYVPKDLKGEKDCLQKVIYNTLMLSVFSLYYNILFFFF